MNEPVLVGSGGTDHVIWFAEVLGGFGCQMFVGDGAKIPATVMRKQGTDGNEAQSLLSLLLRGDFPRVWIHGVENRDARVLFERRPQQVEIQKQIKN